MKLPSSLLFFLLALSGGITSCVDAGLAGGGYGNSGYNSYTVLPSNFNGNAYNHNGLYYTGGRYQNGSFNHQGQTYNNRYYHNGQYYYGGNHYNYSPQQRNGYRSNVNVNTPMLQSHINSQLLQQSR